MASLTIRNLDEDTKARLRIRAARNGHSMEQEARTLLATAVRAAPSAHTDLGQMIQRRLKPLGGVELDLPPRESGRVPPNFKA